MHEKNEFELIDEAARAVREMPIPDGPRELLVQQTLQKLHQSKPPIRAPHWPRPFAAAAMVLMVLGIGLLASYWTTPAYAQLQKQIERATSVSFTAVVHERWGEGKTVRVMLKSPGQMRIETTTQNGPISIFDFASQKMVTLDPMGKRALFGDLTGNSSFITPCNFLDELKEIASTKGVSIGTHHEDGKTLLGFSFISEAARQEVWIDSATHEPAEIDVYGTDGSIRLRCRNIQFDPPADDAMFAMTPPLGYATTKSAAAVAVISRWPRESDLVKGLTRAAEHNAGQFPDGLEPLAARLAKQNDPSLSADIDQLGLAGAFEAMMTDNNYRYVGQGVRFGDATKTVCGWQLPNGKWGVYRGDLSTVELDEWR